MKSDVTYCLHEMVVMHEDLECDAQIAASVVFLDAAQKLEGMLNTDAHKCIRLFRDLAALQVQAVGLVASYPAEGTPTEPSQQEPPAGHQDPDPNPSQDGSDPTNEGAGSPSNDGDSESQEGGTQPQQ